MTRSICDAIAFEFTKSARSKGDHYAELHRVRLQSASADAVSAVVVGTRVYDVSIAREVHDDGIAFVVSCQCPYAADELRPCKHLWATFVEAERAGHLGARQPLPAHVELVLEEADWDQNPLFDDLDADVEMDEIEADDGSLSFTPADKARLGTVMRGRWAALRRGVGVPARSPVVRRPPPPDPGDQALTAIEGHLRTRDAARQAGFPYADQELVYVLVLPRPGHRGGPFVKVMARSLKKDGEWARPRPAQLSINDCARAAEADRPILQALIGARRSAYGGMAWSDDDDTPSEAMFGLPEALASTLLPAILQTGRAFLELQVAPTERPPSSARAYYNVPPAVVTLVPYVWNEGPRWQFAPTVARTARGWRVGGQLVRPGGETLALADVLAADAHFVWTPAGIARGDVGGVLPLMAALAREPDLEILDRDADRLSLALAQLGFRPEDLPPQLHIERLDDVPPGPRVRLSSVAPTSQMLEAEVSFDYDGSVVPHSPGPTHFDSVRRRLIMRRPHEEAAAVDRLVTRGVRRGWDVYERRPRLELPARQIAAVVPALIADGWHVEAEGRAFRAPTGVRMTVSSGIDWFDLEATVDFGEASAPLIDVVLALGRRDPSVRLGDGSTGLLPDTWLRKYLALAATGEAVDGRLRFTRPQTALLDALLEEAERATVDVDEGFRRAREQLARVGAIAAADPPASFTGTLRDYQREGLGWLQFLAQAGLGGCLADDMGLGKTIMVLALLDARREAPDREGRPSVVVVPRSLVHNWLNEAARFAPSLRMVDYSAAGRAKDGRTPDADVLIVTYGTLRRDVLQLKDLDADYAILDEAQAIKNANTASAKAARLLTARHRLALTGTPIENHLGELWSLFEFLNPGVLGRSGIFKRAAAGSTDAESINLLARALRPFILRRTKQQVARELPARTEQTLLCELSKPERALYEGLRRQYRASVLTRVARDGVAGAQMHILEALLRLRQAACHPSLVDRSGTHTSSAKLEVLVSRAQEVVAEGHKALIFSQFTTLLGFVRKELDGLGIDYAYLDGRTRDRAARVRQFQEDPGCRLFLVSLKAGGVGLNLTAAEYVFLLDPWWNPAVEAQAIDRTHRIGQTREVFAYRLVADDTIESKILELQQRKRALADAILASGTGGLKGLRPEDLDELLS